MSRPTPMAIAGLLVAGAVLMGGCASVVNRVAFLPDRAFAIAEDKLPNNVRHVDIATGDHERIEGFVVRESSGATDSGKLVIYFHGNGGNIAQRVPELERIAATAHATVLGVGYRGYGASTGKPSEAGIYRDGDAALRYAREELKFPDERIIVFGRSLGTTVATHVAADRKVACVVLVTPLTSGQDLAKAHGAGLIAFAAGGSFNNLARAPRLVSPVLVIHGTSDEVIPYAEGERVFAAITAPKTFVAIEGGKHNDLEFVDPEKFWGAVGGFIRSPPSR